MHKMDVSACFVHVVWEWLAGMKGFEVTEHTRYEQFGKDASESTGMKGNCKVQKSNLKDIRTLQSMSVMMQEKYWTTKFILLRQK